MSREKEFVKNTIILTVGKISTQLVQFLLLPLYTALLLPEEYGIVDLFNTYITLLVPVFNWQFDRGLFRFLLDVRSDTEGQKRVFSTVALSNIIQIAVYLLFFLVAQNFIHSEYKIFLAIDVAANIVLGSLLQFARGIGHSKAYAFGSFLSTASAVLLNVLFIAGFRMGALGMFLATCLAKFITIAYLVFSQKVWRYFSPKSASKEVFKDVAKFSFPLIPNALSWWVINASDRTVVSMVLGVAANGIYSVANKFSAVFITFYNVFDMSWTESVSLHIEDEDRVEFLTDMTNRMFRFYSSICIGIVAAMPILFPILINRQYGDAYYQIPILMMAVLFQVVVGLYSALYIALKKSVEIAKTSVFSAIINLGVNVALINFIGLYAASVSTLVAFASMAIYRYFHVKRYINIKLKKSTILLTVAVAGVTIASYYLGGFVIQCIVFAGVAVYSFLINKGTLASLWRAMLNKFIRKKTV